MADPVQAVTPHLVVNDGSAAIEFYKQALGATEAFRMTAQDWQAPDACRAASQRHALLPRMTISREHRCTYAADAVFPPRHASREHPVTMHLEVENCDAAVKRAADAGATVTMPPWDAFWGARYARVLDPFGHSWSFAHPLPAKG